MKKYVVVTGGQLFNKGAQAMTFITMDEISRRYPDKEVIVLSNMDFRRTEEEKSIYKFPIMGYPKPAQLILMQSKPGRLFFKLFGGERAKRFVEVMENTAAVVDVSGYALGSNWGIAKTIFYLTRIAVAHSAGAAVYLMPQSFGPFDYKGVTAAFVHRMIRKKLGYAQVIMCREKAGYDLLLNKYKLKNLVLEPDLVLQNMGVNVENIYKQLPPNKGLAVEQNSVAVIPNKKTMQYGNPQKLYSMYQRIIEVLRQQGKQVYLLYHSAEDLEICRKIKEQYFQDESFVVVVERELSCLEFDDLVSRFDFIIASRFHAVVHAYRNAIPAIVPGWAVKYLELMELFGQSSFMFDVRGEIKEEEVEQAVYRMCESFGEHSAQIEKGLSVIRENNVYNYIKI